MKDGVPVSSSASSRSVKVPSRYLEYAALLA